MSKREGTYPPAPFLRGKGSKAPLMASRDGYSDGFERMDHAIETQTPLAQSLAKPIAIPPS